MTWQVTFVSLGSSKEYCKLRSMSSVLNMTTCSSTCKVLKSCSPHGLLSSMNASKALIATAWLRVVDADPSQPQFLNKRILRRLVGALQPAFGLGAIGAQSVDIQIMGCIAK